LFYVIDEDWQYSEIFLTSSKNQDQNSHILKHGLVSQYTTSRKDDKDWTF